MPHICKGSHTPTEDVRAGLQAPKAEQGKP